MSAARNAAIYSPSVALEKGAYRMRAPRRHSTSRLRGSRSAADAFTSQERHMALLIVLLASATVTCFGVAYYLFTTRWETISPQKHVSPRSDQDIQAVPYPYNVALNHTTSNGRFLAYLPHSGFHNQRIAFENALVLSRLLNRTLLVPPMRLGSKPIRYVKYDRLHQYLVLSGKEGLYHCSKIPVYVTPPLECLDYNDFTHIPWDWFVDLTEVRSHQPLAHRWNMTDAWIREHLHIQETETLTLRDSGPYHYRFLDSLDDVSPSKDKYLESIYIPSLAVSTKRLVKIGTLFGSSRLRLRNSTSILIRKQIRQSMAFSNPHLTAPADAIYHDLGGAYLGAHIRVGDSHFKVDSEANARLTWWKLVHGVLNLSINESLALERSFSPKHGAPLRPPRMSPDLAALRTPHPPPPPLPAALSLRRSCRGELHSLSQLALLNTPLFISTDAREPLADPALSLFLRTFPCAFFLTDFPMHAVPLTNLRNAYDGVRMDGFLMPFLDAMVVGRAWQVVGTEGSTFSRFVQDVLWRTYHGLDIVLRG